MVAKRFLSVFYPAAQFEVTTRITRVEDEPFKTEGKILVFPGWLEIYGREEQDADDQPALVPVQDNETVKTQEIEVKGLETRPPARYTEATLLSAMEGAGKLIEDEELREAMAAKGLGTPATRAATIEGLLAEEYLRREGREISSTPKAWALMELLHAVDIPALASPEMTGEWEYKLKQMEHGELPRSLFMQEIVGLTQTIVEKAKNFEESGFDAEAAWLQRAERQADGRDAAQLRDRGQLGHVAQGRGRASARAARSEGTAREAAHRPAAGLPQQGGLALRRRAETQRRGRDRIRLRQRAGQCRRHDARCRDNRNRSGNAPSAAGVSSRR